MPRVPRRIARAVAGALVAIAIVASSGPPAVAEDAGTLDAGFGNGGIVTAGLGVGSAAATGVAVDSRGRVVVVGNTYDGTRTAIVVGRFLADGASDTAFGGGDVPPGLATVAREGNLTATAVAIDSDDRLLIAGSIEDAAGLHPIVVRLDVDGSGDATFDGDAVAIIPVPVDGTAFAIGITPDGAIIVGGDATTSAEVYQPFVARLLPDGALDTTFSPGTGDGSVAGVALVDTGHTDDRTRSLALAADGDIVVAGGEATGDAPHAMVARLDASGSPDPAFGGGSVVNVPGAMAVGVAFDAEGRIVLGATGTDGQRWYASAIRLLADGAIDTTFGPAGDGHAISTGLPELVYATAIVIDTAGNIVVAGYADPGNGNADTVVVRFDADGRPDEAFGGTLSLGEGYDILAAATIANGRVYLAGGSTSVDPVGNVVIVVAVVL